MIGKILILATVAVANARHVLVDIDGATTTSDLCPSQGHHLLPHEWDCTKFYYCEYGEKWVTPRDCAPGTEFSYEIQTCVHPGAANCQLPGVPPTSEESEESAETETPTEVPTTEPTSTTEAPRPSTEAATLGPVFTTEAPTPSTEAATLEPASTTAAPRPSTEAATLGPVFTTEAPTPSTEAATLEPASTTEAPRPSTEAATLGPVFTTEAPSPSTEAATLEPASTTEAPRPSTEAATLGPVFTTEAPTPSTEAATLEPASTTETPRPSTEAATLGPVITTEAPSPSTEAATLEPASTTEAPTPTTEAATLPTSTTETATEAETEATTEAATEAPELELLPNGCPVDFDVHYLLPHETRCDKFYYCVFGNKVVRDCPSNTAFNPALQVCDDPEKVDCVNTESSEASEEGSGSSEISEEASGEDLEGSGEVDIDVEELLPNGCPADFDVHKLLPHESDCSKFYYCVFGETVERECGPETLFNAELEVCDRPENVVCANAGSGENESNESAENGNSSSNENNGNSNENNGNSEETDILDNGCPADFDIHQLLPHESDCTKFYYCVFGQKLERNCDSGTHFNPTLQVCDWPQNAGCANAGSNENESTGSAENGNSQETSEESGASNENGNSEETNNSSEETTTTAVPETDPTTLAPITLPTEAPEIELLPNGCPADFDVHQLLPHESDCTKFYYCVFGEKVERDCAPETHFNPTLQVCDRPENAGCANAGSGENEGSGSAENGNSDSNEDNGNGNESNGNSNENNGSNEESGILPNGCPADFDVHKLLPHEYECSKFYYCVFGEKVERDCAPGTHFSPTEQVCDVPENVLCVGKAGSSVESSSEEKSTSEEVVGPILPNGCPSDFDVHQLLPHESDCAKFYYCVFGEKVERDCGPETHFSPTLQVCVRPEDAGCSSAGSNENESAGSAENGNSQETSEENGTSNENDNSEETDNSREETTTTAAPETDPTTPAPTTLPTEAPEIELLPNGCPADFDVHQLLPHESDCSKFYYCVFGEKVERDCDPDTHFNPTLQVCDWPENAECANAGSQESDSGDSAENGSQESSEGSGDGNENGSNEETGNSSEETTTTAAPETDATTPEPITLPTEAPELELLPNGCPADFDIHQLLPHESDCSKFYYCLFGEKVERDCGPDTHFNPTLQVTTKWRLIVYNNRVKIIQNPYIYH
ncbi:chitin-binding domain protein cbd-1-like [Cydia pomonella]|uniref:chitin-binding domain protein cbd-1-like n=1 Tax=Cydia pomonella TaxID=82600 RepID=UPI002ADDA6AC|nr:chitin-binding domain protein cbd-1-like [Cydia pomonella]